MGIHDLRARSHEEAQHDLTAASPNRMKTFALVPLGGEGREQRQMSGSPKKVVKQKQEFYRFAMRAPAIAQEHLYDIATRLHRIIL